MAEVDFTVGHKEYRVAAQDGEERLLQRAAALLDAEAQQILSQAGRVPEARLLLLAGLMLADRVATLEERAEKAERHLNRLQASSAMASCWVIPSICIVVPMSPWPMSAMSSSGAGGSPQACSQVCMSSISGP